MTLSVKHAFVSAKADGPDSTRLRPSNWNAEHVVELASGTVIGRLTAGVGPAEEVSIANLFPAGVMLPFAGTAAPSGWALPFGQAISRSANPKNFTAFGTTYGVGDGSTTFNLPDARGVVFAGKSNMGGSDRGNLSGGTTLGALLGSQVSAASIFIGVSGSFSGGTSGSLTVSVGGTTDPTGQTANVGGGGTNVATDTHQHFVVSNGVTSGAIACSGSISGVASGSSATFGVVQPTLVVNVIMPLG